MWYRPSHLFKIPIYFRLYFLICICVSFCWVIFLFGENDMLQEIKIRAKDTTHLLSNIHKRSPQSIPILLIHVFTMSRPTSFQRLWQSLNNAFTVPDSSLNVKIHIHVDFDETVTDANRLTHLSFLECIHGKVEIHYALHTKGLRFSILEAWTPPQQDNTFALFLEDDIEVSPLFLIYAQSIISAYGQKLWTK